MRKSWPSRGTAYTRPQRRRGHRAGQDLNQDKRADSRKHRTVAQDEMGEGGG